MSQTLFSLLDLAVQAVAFLFGLRFLLQATQASFYNPISQFVVKSTGIIAEPLRKIIRPIGRWDFVSLILMGIVFYFSYLLNPPRTGLPILSFIILSMAYLLLWTLIVSALLEVIFSWLQAHLRQSPIVGFVVSLNTPFLTPFRRILPPAGGLDFCPMIYILILVVLKNIVEQQLS